MKEMSQKFKQRIGKTMTAVGTVVFSTLQNSLVLANGENPLDKPTKAATGVREVIQTGSTIVAVIAVMICGVLFMFGDNGKRKASSWLPWIFLGVAVISGATALVTWFSSFFS
jgi:type IV secretory pathway VirB2 component (pilin)